MNRSNPGKSRIHVVKCLRCISDLVSSTFQGRLVAENISAHQWRVLRAVWARPDVMLRDVAEEAGRDISSTSRIAARLVRKGLLTHALGKDRREIRLGLTDDAKELVPELARLAAQKDADYFRTLSAVQRKEFLAIIKQLLAANRAK
jgi:DNA-binding MarR family transcriptional regulator